MTNLKWLGEGGCEMMLPLISSLDSPWFSSCQVTGSKQIKNLTSQCVWDVNNLLPQNFVGVKNFYGFKKQLKFEEMWQKTYSNL